MAPRPRVCLIGPESTGKTELAPPLAAALGWPWVPEFAREYAETVARELTAADVEPIARGQMAGEDAVAAPVILDTDLVSTIVYARHYYGACPDWIEREAWKRRADLYLLCDTDLPWEADEVRTAGGDEREDQFDAFRAALEDLGVPWVIVSGNREERFEVALNAIRTALSGSSGS
jgi:NadR type nicotinamide-nucleotide adenylyltransferase